MSDIIDNKVVEMQFDNKQFEEGVKTSLSTIDKLKESLRFDGIQKGFENINGAVKNCDFLGMRNAIETVHTKFSALEVMAVTTLANITNSAVNAGKQLVKSLALDPIRQGFGEYELKMGSIQTIMASTGESLDTVNGYLNELNAYADKTIYSFSDMTSNIGKFTNAGVKLKDAVKAIQGISNEAAVSGANANEASRAMYNFAQALSAGYVKLIDWKSIENANMATVEFKRQLIDTALELGTIVKVGDKYQTTTTDLNGKVSELFTATSMFNDSLSAQWMTTDVLVKTLGDYADETTEIGKKAFAAAQDVKTFTQLMDTLKEASGSGWATTWEIIFGNFEEGKTLWTSVSKVVGGLIDRMSDARNSLLQGWKDLGGRDDLLDAFRNVGESVGDIIEPIKEAFRNIFPATTSEQLKKITERIKQFTENLKINEETAEKIKDTFKGVFSILDVLKKTVWAVGKSFSPLTKRFREISGGILDSASNFGKFLTGISESADRIGAFEEITKRLSGAISVLSDLIFDFADNTIVSFVEGGEGISGAFEVVFDIIANVTRAIYDLVSALTGIDLSESREKVVSVIQNIRNIVVDAIDDIGKFLLKVKEALHIPDLETIKIGISDFISSIKENFQVPGFELFHNILERIHERLSQLGDLVETIKSVISTTVKTIAEDISGSNLLTIIEKIWEAVKTVIGGIVKGIGILTKAVSNGLGDADFSKTFDLFNSISLGAIATGLIAFVKGFKDAVKDISSIKDSFIGVLDGVKECLSAFTMQIKADALMKISGALAILAGAILVISLINSDKLTASLEALTVMFINIIAALTALDKLVEGKTGIVKVSIAMIAMSTAILVLAAALKKVSDIEPERLAGGMVAMTIMLAELIAASRTIGTDSKGMMKSAAAMVIFSAAVKVLASACKDFSSMNWEEIGKGLLGVGALLAEINIFLNMAKFNKGAVSSGIGIVLIASAIKILASACKDFSSMNWGEIGKGLATIGGLLLEITAFTNLSGNSKHVMSTGMSLIAIASALKILASAMSDFGVMSWEEIGKGLLAIGAALLEVAAATTLMPKNLLAIGTGLILVGAALEIMANVLGKFGGFSWEEIGKGLLTLGVALAELAIALNAMRGTIAGAGALAVAAASLLLITPVLSILGAMSWEAIAKGLISLAGAFTVIGVAGAVLAPIMPAILGLGAALSLIGVGVLALGVGLVAAGAGITALGVGVTTLSATLTAVAAAIVASISVIILGILDMVPNIITSLGAMVIALCDAIAQAAPSLGTAIKAVVLSLVDVIIECAPQIVEGLLVLLEEALKSLFEHIGPICDSLFEIVIAILDSISEHTPEFIQAVVGVFKSIFDGVAALFDGDGAADLLESIARIGNALGSIFGSFIGGIAGGILDGVVSQFPEMGQNLSDFMTNAKPFFDGLKNIDASTVEAVGALAGVLVALTASELLDGLASWFTGGNSLSKFGRELADFAPYLVEYSRSISGLDSGTVSKSAEAGKALAEMAKAFPNDGGVIGWFMGENNASTFGKNIAEFGPSLMAYAKSVKGLDADGVINSVEPAIAIAEMAKAFPNDGGVIGWFMGENNASMFGENIATFGVYIAKYAKSVAGLDVKAVTDSVEPSIALAEMAKGFPNEGGALSWFTGENGAGEFGKAIAVFGAYLESYYNYIDDINFTKVVRSAESVDEFATAISKLSKSDNDKKLKNLGKGLSDFGEKFAKYYTDISGIDSNTLINVTKGISKVINVSADMADIDSKKFGEFGNNLAKIGKEGLTAFVQSFSDASGKIKSAGSKMIADFISGANSSKDELNAALDLMTKYAIDCLDENGSDFECAGSEVISYIIIGFENKKASAVDTVSRLMTQIISSIERKYNEFSQAGSYLIDGFANGINSSAYEVTNASKLIGIKSIGAINAELLINSPSERAYDSGTYFVDGFIIALSNYSEKAYDAAYSVGREARSGLNDAIERMSSIVGNDMDIQPVISPVVDLSNVSRSADAIRGLLSNQSAIELAGMVGESMNASRNRIQNEESLSNDGIINAINSLREDVSNLSKKVGNMKMVMDSGELVGALSNKMDAAIGNRQKLVSLGVYR